ncbi:MAG TPA: M48 family metalloprotease [Quisquiliibacterium sp.]|nr:M48 family metalloprotease [Quisquiliibacterium sp.]
MNFFAQQALARRQARRMVVLFALAVTGVVVGVNAACTLAFLAFYPGTHLSSGATFGVAGLPPLFHLTNTAIVLLFVLGGALVEWSRLSEGGVAVARLLGARALAAEPTDAGERRLRNIAEEMAVAAGAPVPQLFLLDDEPAINACAVGHDARDAAVIVTRGALRRLNRDELQGVFAHEYAHVLHGDVRLNLTLTAYVYGILIVHQFGRALLGWAHPQRFHPTSGEDPRALPLAIAAAVLGAAIMAVGAVGWLAARLLQAAVSRQREFLADATAVRFTRLPDGLGNALRKLAGVERARGERLLGPGTGLLAHAWLVAPGRLAGWLATHPPLAERIRRIFGRPMRAITEDDARRAQAVDEPVHARPAPDPRDVPLEFDPRG